MAVRGERCGLSTYLGHSSITITFHLYGHLMPGYMDYAASMLDAYLGRRGPVPSEARDRGESAVSVQ